MPVANYTGGNLVRARLALLQKDGGWINPAKVKMIQKAVNAACDTLDGLADGVIGAYEKCKSVFDVGNAALRERRGYRRHLPFRCANRGRQLRAPAFPYPFPLKNGVTSFPGWNYGSDDQPGGMEENITGKSPPRFPITSENEQSVAWVNADGFVRYYVRARREVQFAQIHRRGLRRPHSARFRRCSTRPIRISRRSSLAAAS